MPEPKETTKTLQQVYNDVKNIKAPIRISVDRRDICIEKADKAAGDDLFAEVAAAN